MVLMVLAAVVGGFTLGVYKVRSYVQNEAMYSIIRLMKTVDRTDRQKKCICIFCIYIKVIIRCTHDC